MRRRNTTKVTPAKKPAAKAKRPASAKRPTTVKRAGRPSSSHHRSSARATRAPKSGPVSGLVTKSRRAAGPPPVAKNPSVADATLVLRDQADAPAKAARKGVW